MPSAFFLEGRSGASRDAFPSGAWERHEGGAWGDGKNSNESIVMKKRVLVIDDDCALGELLSEYLAQHDFVVSHAARPGEGIARLSASGADVVVLDVMMPEMSGFEACKTIRAEHPGIPILMLTARGEVADRVMGLEFGADDYMPKPFEPRELAARLAALLRRSAVAPTPGKILKWRDLRADLTRRRLWRVSETGAEEDIPLTSVEFRAFASLVRRRPAVVRREHLVEELRGFEGDWFDRSADICVSRLRAKLGDDPRHPKFIRTVRGEGYAFIAPDEA